MNVKLKQTQRGNATSIVLIVIGLICAIGVAWDYSPAPADEIKSVVAMSSDAPVVKASVQEFLSANPSPNNKELKEFKRSVNELLVLEEAKKVTGDRRLKSASEQKAELDKAAQEKQEAQRQQLEAKSLGQMSSEEVATYLMLKLLDWWPLGLFFMLFFVVFAGFRKAERGELGF